MNYTESISDFFKSPQWMMNLLLGGVCVLIPIIGPMVVLGWLITGFWARQDQNFVTFPPFDFSHFSKYLERGLWPFLVALVVSMAFSIVMVPVTWVMIIPTMVVGGLSSGNEPNAGTCFGAVAMIVAIAVIAVLLFALMLTLVPLKIRASLTQDFGKSFDFHFLKRFLALTWKETVLSSLFVMIVGTLIIFLGVIVFCVGMYFATVLVYFSWTHLHKQLYALYLSRGGEPVPLSPKLQEPALAVPGI